MRETRLAGSVPWHVCHDHISQGCQQTRKLEAGEGMLEGGECLQH